MNTIYTVELYGDFDMPYTAFIGDLVKAQKHIDGLPADTEFILLEWKWNSGKSKRVNYTRASERIQYQG